MDKPLIHCVPQNSKVVFCLHVDPPWINVDLFLDKNLIKHGENDGNISSYFKKWKIKKNSEMEKRLPVPRKRAYLENAPIL